MKNFSRSVQIFFLGALSNRSIKRLGNIIFRTEYEILHRQFSQCTQMINSDLIQTLVIDSPNLRMNNRGKIIGGDSLGRFTEAAKTGFLNVFKTFSLKSGLWRKVACANWKL